MAGTGIMAGICTSHTHHHTQLKKSGIPHIHTHTQLIRGFPVKTGTDSGNTHGDEFICHLYMWWCEWGGSYSITLLWGYERGRFVCSVLTVERCCVGRYVADGSHVLDYTRIGP